MKTINNFITEKLQLSRHKVDTALKDYSYIDDMPLGIDKSEEVYNVIFDRYDDMFSDVRLLKSGNIKLGRINVTYLISNGNGLYNDSDFTLYIYKNEYVIRRTNLGTFSPHLDKFVEGFNSLTETLDKFESKLTKRGYKFDFK